jgi:hypothetical protein
MPGEELVVKLSDTMVDDKDDDLVVLVGLEVRFGVFAVWYSRQYPATLRIPPVPPFPPVAVALNILINGSRDIDGVVATLSWPHIEA